MKYNVVLDSESSYIEPVENGGISFEDAIGSIIDYCKEASYELQEVVWSLILEDGEDRFSSRTISLH